MYLIALSMAKLLSALRMVGCTDESEGVCFWDNPRKTEAGGQKGRRAKRREEGMTRNRFNSFEDLFHAHTLLSDSEDSCLFGLSGRPGFIQEYASDGSGA